MSARNQPRLSFSSMFSTNIIRKRVYAEFVKVKCGASIIVQVSSRSRVSATRPTKAKSRLKAGQSEKAEVDALLTF